MKVTKYPQSCLLLEKSGRRIVIDPGNFFSAKYSVADLGKIEAVLYTHQHGDHFDTGLFDELKAAGANLYGNAAVAALIGAEAIEVKSGQAFSVAGFDVLPHDLPHFPKEGVEMPHNTGFVIDGNFFHPGDGTKTSGLTIHDLAAPVGGPFEYQDIKDFALSLSAKKVIPIHFTNVAMYQADPKEFAKVIGDEIEVIQLNDGGSVEL